VQVRRERSAAGSASLVGADILSKSVKKRNAQTPRKNIRRATMKFQLLIALALILGLHHGAVVQDVAFETGIAANETGHVAAKAIKETAHGTTAVEDTSRGTGHVVKKAGHGVKKGVDGFGHGVEKGATKTADVLK
jgi:hypothetical protein